MAHLNPETILRLLDLAADFGLKESNHRRYRLGCIILNGKNRIFGRNYLKTHTQSTSPYNYVHAEFDALQRSYRKIGEMNRAIMFVGRKRKDGTLGKARPCSFCTKTIRMAGIRKVYWSETNGFGELTIL